MTQLYLIRHGEAFSNINGTIEGALCCQGLTERGFKQVAALANRLAGNPLKADVLYGSTLKRAQQTAEAVSVALGLPVQWEDELHELRPGDADGWAFAKLAASPGFRDFVSRADSPIAPNGESWSAFHYRVAGVLDRLIEQHTGQTIVVVAHGGVTEAGSMHLMGLPPLARTRLSLSSMNTALTHWHHTKDFSGIHGWRLMSHNDHRHLDGLDV